MDRRRIIPQELKALVWLDVKQCPIRDSTPSTESELYHPIGASGFESGLGMGVRRDDECHVENAR